MRLFIAIEISEAMRKELALLLKAARERCCGGRFVPAENFHITMHFIGESDDLAGAVAAMHEACRGIRPFTLSLGSYGYFERNERCLKTALVNVTGDLDELSVLHETLESALADNGFSREYKRFKPHITLGRNVEQDELVLEELKAIPLSGSVTVTGITLFESTRVKGRMVYTPLHREKF